jgi:large subunit ribosomal protein L14e
MGDAEIKATTWRLVEVGRIALIHGGPSDGKLAAIVEIIDHKRVCIACGRLWTSKQSTDRRKALIDGPSTDTKTAVPRQSIALAQLILTPLVLEKLPRGARTGAVKKQWEKAGIEAKWQESAWAKKRQQKERRRALTDFERFKVMRLRKQARFEVRKSLAKVKASA